MGFYVIINKVDTPSFHCLLKRKKKHIFPPPCHPWRSQTRRQKVKNFTIRQRLKHFLWKSLNINRQYSNVCSNGSVAPSYEAPCPSVGWFVVGRPKFPKGAGKFHLTHWLPHVIPAMSRTPSYSWLRKIGPLGALVFWNLTKLMEHWLE